MQHHLCFSKSLVPCEVAPLARQPCIETTAVISTPSSSERPPKTGPLSSLSLSSSRTCASRTDRSPPSVRRMFGDGREHAHDDANKVPVWVGRVWCEADLETMATKTRFDATQRAVSGQPLSTRRFVSASCWGRERAIKLSYSKVSRNPKASQQIHFGGRTFPSLRTRTIQSSPAIASLQL